VLFRSFHGAVGQPVYVYSSIFSPESFNFQIVHEWQHYDETAKDWVTMSQIELPIIGGRDGGFRTYSDQNVSVFGLWRVNVKTLQGQLIGRIKFDVENADVPPSLAENTLE
jgi:hypothetical protein